MRGYIAFPLDRTDTTDFKGPMYADPSRQLYHTLGLIENLDRTPAGQEKRSYLGKGFLGNMLSSIWVGVLLTLPGRSGVFAMQNTSLGD